MVYLSTFFIALFITIALVPIFRSLAFKAALLDVPNQRSVHTAPIPRNGGIAMALGILFPVFMLVPMDSFVKALLIGTAIIIGGGAIDDIRRLGYRAKFMYQLLAALVVVFYGGVQIRSLGTLLPEGFLLPKLLAVPLSVIVIIGVTNAINLADGLDGLAGGIALVSFFFLGAMAWQCGYTQTLLVCAAIQGALVAFLIYNTHPATVFMGDAGSQMLGFTAIVVALHLSQVNIPLSPLMPLLLLGFPILDTLTVMSERIMNGRSPFVADRNHFHHKLMALGLDHSEAVFCIYLLQSLLVVLAYGLRYYSDWVLLGAYLLLAGSILCGFYQARRYGKRFRRLPFVDEIKGRLRVIRNRRPLIVISARTLEYGLPALLLANCMWSSGRPLNIAWAALGMLVTIIFTARRKKVWLEHVLKLFVYLFVPLTVIYSEERLTAVSIGYIYNAYSLVYLAVFSAALVTMRLTRRRAAFRSDAMDFLILLITCSFIVISSGNVGVFKLSAIFIKIVIMLYSFEIFIGEQRGRNRLFIATAFAALLLTAGVGLFWPNGA